MLPEWWRAPAVHSKERDTETGLDYFGARYYGSTQGRFTGVDPIMITPVRMVDPQQLNLYSYTRNNPLAFIDEGGMQTKRAAPAKPTLKINKPTVNRTTYDVKGATASEAWDNAKKHDGFAGYTSAEVDIKWNASYTVRQQRNRSWTATMTVNSIEVNTTITVDTPNWVDAPNAPQSEQTAWNEGLANLNAHEEGHVEIATEGAEAQGNAVAAGVSPVRANGKTATEAIENAKGQVGQQVRQARQAPQQETERRNKEYDQKTDHGRKKPENE